MAIFGPGSFESDQAMDFVYDLLDSGGFEFVEEALVAEPTAEVDACLGTDVITAAEIVAAALGKPAIDLPEELASWLAEHRLPRMEQQRERALRWVRAVRGETSELHQVWRDSELGVTPWLNVLDDLEQRLAQLSPL